MKDRKVSSQQHLRDVVVIFVVLALVFQVLLYQFSTGFLDFVVIGIALPALLTFAVMQRRQ